MIQKSAFTFVNGVKSDLANGVLGFPQGTAFGPLFSLHIDDISSGIESEIRFFVGDCVAIVKLRIWWIH